MELYNPDTEFSGVSPDGRAGRSAPADVSAAAAAGRPILPAQSPSPEVSAPAEPEVVTLAMTQTITAPPVTVQSRDRKPSPGKPAGSSNDGGRPVKDDGDGKDDKDKGEDKGPPKPPRKGGKKDPDDSDGGGSSPELPSEEVEEVRQGNMG